MFIEVDTTAAPERRLLSQVILLALNDACHAPLKGERQIRMSTVAFTAMRFLFDESVSGLNAYANWLDFEPTNFRRKLLEIMENNGPNKIGEWDSMHRRWFRQNYRLWQEMKNIELDIDEEEDDNELV